MGGGASKKAKAEAVDDQAKAEAAAAAKAEGEAAAKAEAKAAEKAAQEAAVAQALEAEMSPEMSQALEAEMSRVDDSPLGRRAITRRGSENRGAAAVAGLSRQPAHVADRPEGMKVIRAKSKDDIDIQATAEQNSSVREETDDEVLREQVTPAVRGGECLRTRLRLQGG